MNLNNTKRVHFIGIGGISMSGLAEILHKNGYAISGSDATDSDIIKHLKQIGINVFLSHEQKNITNDIELVVYTAAIKEDNPEIIAAKQKNIKIVDRAFLLGVMMQSYKCPICISGTHGKTSTSSMVAEILIAADKNPTVTIGGIVPSINSSFLIGGEQYMVIEACEYFNSFLKFKPKAGIILNIEPDHLDFFKDISHIEASFNEFANNIKEDGFLVINGNIENLDNITKNLKCRIITYGNKNSNWFCENILFDENGCSSFDIVRHGQKICRLSLKVIGIHNAHNCIAAFACAYELGIDVSKIIKGLESFIGAKRRYEFKGSFNGVTVVDDYAHHPTEIKATLAAAKKSKHRKLFCVFQPHTYTRTINLLDDFANSFENADEIIILDIYSAREKDLGVVHSKHLADKINKLKGNAHYFSSFEEAQNFLLKTCVKDDLLITMGAGDVYILGENIVNKSLES